MKIALFGATGTIGSRILNEALARGHAVTVVSRDPSKIVPRPGVVAVAGDIQDAASIAVAVSGHDAVVSAYGPGKGDPALLSSALRALVAGLRAAAGARLAVVGGAGSLKVAPALDLVDTATFPAAYKPVALAHRDALRFIETVTDVDWSYLSPAAIVTPGERTGRFRLGADELVADAAGKSFISAEDFAVALLDEVETPAHVRKRFTLAY